MPGFKPCVLMMPDGLATTHDPAGHNLLHGTPAIYAFCYDPFHSIPDPASRKYAILRCGFRRGKTRKDVGSTVSIVTLPADTSNVIMLDTSITTKLELFFMQAMQYDNLTCVYIVTFKFIHI